MTEGDSMARQRTFRIAAIPGDGVGGEVIAAGRAVLDAVAPGALEWEEFPWGCEYYQRTGRMMAADGLARLREFDAIYFGAVGLAVRSRPRQPVGPAAGDLPGVRPVGERPAGPVPPRCDQPAAEGRPDLAGLGRDPGEQRGRVRGLRRPQPVQPRPGRRSGGPVGAVHRDRLRADHPLRLRSGPHSQPPQGHQRHEEQCAAVRHGAVG